jgi:hypothetical protein
MHEAGQVFIHLDEYFEKGFFYKGPKWTRDSYKKVNYYAWVQPWDVQKKEITELRGISAADGLFRLEIENNTYPHRGYAVLDLKDFKIVETGKI